MKLTYWVSEIQADSSVYNIRAETKKECTRLLAEAGTHNTYGPVKKVTIEYSSAFKLMEECLSEGNGYWEISY